jgi:hypothetical protein
MYREILLNSDAFSRGDKNHPVFVFPEDLNFEYFCVRTAEFPNFYYNLAQNETIGIVTYNANGTVAQYKYMIVQSQNFPNVTSLVTMLNFLMNDLTGGNTKFTNNPVFSVVNTYFIGLNPQFGLSWSIDFSGVMSQSSGSNLGANLIVYLNATVPNPGNLIPAQNTYVSKYLRRLFGYDTSVTISPKLDGISTADQTLGAIKATRDNYLLLKSNAMSGATFTPNTTFQGAYTNSNVIGKIPVNQGTFPYGTFVFYETNQNPSPENMFSFNGGKIGNFDLYFVRPDPSMSEDPIDFQGWNFSVTLGIISNVSP